MRIDRATFQYHYYTSLPFLVDGPGLLPGRAVARGVAPDLARWPGCRPPLVVIGPGLLWVFKGPLCAFVRVDTANPGSGACVDSPRAIC